MALAFEQFAPPGSGAIDGADPAPEPPKLTAEPALSEETSLAETEDVSGRIASTLEAIASDAERLRFQAIVAAAHALGEAAETLMPALARAGFAPCLAEIASQIAGRVGTPPGLRLAHAPEDRDAIQTALAALPDQASVILDEDLARAPGSADLTWADGGARIDVEAMAAAALDEARRRFEGTTL
ncbi:MAG: hypothetical protein OEN23_05385 [Paracoccaceae bacterium]|nr:hypothetical protein [Paracoccaceae bacterium]